MSYRWLARYHKKHPRSQLYIQPASSIEVGAERFAVGPGTADAPKSRYGEQEHSFRKGIWN